MRHPTTSGPLIVGMLLVSACSPTAAPPATPLQTSAAATPTPTPTSVTTPAATPTLAVTPAATPTEVATPVPTETVAAATQTPEPTLAATPTANPANAMEEAVRQVIALFTGGLLTLPDGTEVHEDAAGDLFSFGSVVGSTTPFVDLLATAGFVVDLDAATAAALSDELACEAASAGGVRLATVPGAFVSCNQKEPLEAGEHTIIVTGYQGPLPDPFPQDASCSWAVQTNTDDDPTTGFPNPPPGHPLTGADRYQETVLFYSPTNGELQNYNLATDYNEPPRADTGKQQGNLPTRTRVKFGSDVVPTVKDVLWFMYVIPAEDFGPNFGAHAYCFGDTNDRAETTAVDSSWNKKEGDPLHGNPLFYVPAAK